MLSFSVTVGDIQRPTLLVLNGQRNLWGVELMLHLSKQDFLMLQLAMVWCKYFTGGDLGEAGQY